VTSSLLCPAPHPADAVRHLDSAMHALTLQGWQSSATAPSGWTALPALECTIADELDRVDRALGPRGASMFAGLADCVRAAVEGIEAARQCLGAPPYVRTETDEPD